MMDKLRVSSCFIVTLLLSLALALPLPLMTAEEGRIYALFTQHYKSLYEVPEHMPMPYDQYSHLSGAHPHLEDQALQHAQQPRNGPFFSERRHEALYISTQVQSTSHLGGIWNLKMQEGGRLNNVDAHLFWRIDQAGARLLRLDVFPIGVQPQEEMPMQTAINLASRLGRRRLGGCSSCF